MTPRLPLWRQAERAAARSLKPRPSIPRRCNLCRADFLATSIHIHTCPRCKRRRGLNSAFAGIGPAAAISLALLFGGADPVRSDNLSQPVTPIAFTPPTAEQIATENIRVWQAATLSADFSMEICDRGRCHSIHPDLARFMLRTAIEIERETIDELRRKKQQSGLASPNGPSVLAAPNGQSVTRATSPGEDMASQKKARTR